MQDTSDFLVQQVAREVVEVDFNVDECVVFVWNFVELRSPLILVSNSLCCMRFGFEYLLFDVVDVGLEA